MFLLTSRDPRKYAVDHPLADISRDRQGGHGTRKAPNPAILKQTACDSTSWRRKLIFLHFRYRNLENLSLWVSTFLIFCIFGVELSKILYFWRPGTSREHL